MNVTLVDSFSERHLFAARRLATLAVSLIAAFVCAIAAPSAHAALTVTEFTASTASTVAGAHSDGTAAFSFQLAFTGGIQRLEHPIPAGGPPGDITLRLPPGLVGFARSVPQCTVTTFHAAGCLPDTQIGAGNAYVSGGGVLEASGTPQSSGGVIFPAQLYNLATAPDQAVMIGLEVDAFGVLGEQLITATVHAADGYAVTLSAPDTPRPLGVTLLGASLTLWGVPSDPSHDAQRACSFGGAVLNCASDAPRLPFLENPTSCAEVPVTVFSVNTLEEPDVLTEASAAAPLPTDCADVPFSPSISLTPDTTQAGSPTGLAVDLSVPQSNDPDGRGTSELKQAVVTVPSGMTISPSAASKELQGCTDAQFGAGSDAPANCPVASQIGTDEVESPLLPSPSTGGKGKLTGKVFLGQPLSTNPTSGQMFRVFQELQGFGVDVKLEGSIVANPETGQLTTTFANLPELPFQNFRLHFNGGPNAVLVNPPTCAQNTTTTQLYPYSGNPPATPSSTFTTSYDGSGAPCPVTLPFAPSSSISTALSQAGALSPMTVTFTRADETQPLGQIDVTLPEGLLGYISKVALCEAAAAVAGTCGPESRIGTVSARAGAGSDPLTVQGSVYLAHGSNGYPFMLSVVVPAVAGPYDLGDVVVPVWLQVNSNGSITAVSGPLPSILDGIPLDIRSVTMTLDRPGFTVTPTNCGALSLTGTATSLSGTTAVLSAPFSVSGCGNLPFKPSFTVDTQGSTSKQNGASLTVRVAENPGDADIHSVHVELPKSLPSRLSTLHKACTERQFAANPAGCPPGSIVGSAVAYTPLLPVPVNGPAIFVSHAGAAFPDLDIILQGDGITIDLVGNTNIKHDITASTFASVPDVPISGFELNLPEGPYSIFAASGNLCEQKLFMPTTITGQNGVVVNQTARIAVSGCAQPKPAIKITKVTAKVSQILVTVRATAKGTVRVSGRGIIARAAKNVSAGIHVVAVKFTNLNGATLARRKTLELRVTLTTSAGRVSVATTRSATL